MDPYIAKINNLPPDVREFFLSTKPMTELKKAFALFEVRSSQSGEIAKEVGQIFVGDFNLKELPRLIIEKIGIDKETAISVAYEINKRLFQKFTNHFKDSLGLLNDWKDFAKTSAISEDEAWKKVLEENPWIADLEIEEAEEKRKEEETKKKKKANLVRFSIFQAIQKYPKLGEQLLTSSPIKLKIFPGPIRPSIKNWIADYHAVLGAGSHATMERGNYLYHSENAKRVSAGERQKLAVILKSLDENELLIIDSERQEVVFPLLSESARPASSNTASIGRSSESAFANQGAARLAESRPAPSAQLQVPKNPVSSVPTKTSFADRFWPRGNDQKNQSIPQEQQISAGYAPKQTEIKQSGNRDGFSYSYPQKMPSESFQKSVTEAGTGTPAPSPHSQVNSRPVAAKSSDNFSPYRIHPHQYEGSSVYGKERENGDSNGPKINGNVVDLRN
jgi:hypothetical protein